jgi:threonine synthase
MGNESLKYISTRGHQKKLEFHDVIFEGLAPDGGLYVPETWPILDNDTINSFNKKTYQEIAFEVISPYVGKSLSNENLKNIIHKAYLEFDSNEITPISKLNNSHYLLELYHGPTFAFKDVAMQFIGQLINYYLNQDKTFINILGATSGDTGAAAIEGFKNIKSSKIFILHPYNKISEVQRKFMTTVKSDNVYNIAIKGSFDDCQIIIKEIFSDYKYKKQKNLIAVNSINWARIMCQIVYYFYALSRLKNNNEKVLFSVPTGNFGDILAGYIAKKMGLPIDMLNIATNENDILTRTLQSGKHELKDVKSTSSPSIDIQISSNFERLLYDITKDSKYILTIMNDLKNLNSYQLDKPTIEKIQESFCSYMVTESEVKKLIKETYDQYNTVIDPHTAVGLGSAKKCKNIYDVIITLSTAHPAKFKETVSSAINNTSFIPKKIEKMMNFDENLIILDNDVQLVKNFINDNTL